MTNTTKYILVGGVALVATVIVYNRVQAAKAAAAKPSGLSGVLSGVKQIYDSSKGFSFRSAPSLLPQDGLPYGGSASDGTAAITDAMGTRQLHAVVPAQTSYLTNAQLNLAGVYTS